MTLHLDSESTGMSLGVSMWSYFQSWRDGKIDIPGFIYEAKRAGADFVELLDFFYRDRDADRLLAKKALSETGLPVRIFSISNNFAKPETVDRRAEVDKVRNGIDEALRYEAKIVRVFAGDVSDGITFEDARAWIVEGLAEASRLAQEAGVVLALENHGKLAGRSDQVIGIIRDVNAAAGNEALRANPDTGNFVLVNEKSDDAVAAVAPYAAMVHFKDFRRVGEGQTGVTYTALDGAKYAGTALGEGDVDLGACISGLKAAGYRGPLSIEYEGMEDPLAAVPRCLASARRYL